MKQLRYYVSIESITLKTLLTAVLVLTLLTDAGHAQNPSEWNSDWTSFKKVYVQETAGFDRVNEPVEAEVKYYQKMQQQNEYVLSKQLLRSGTSIGANVEEATAAQSRKDFISKYWAIIRSI